MGIRAANGEQEIPFRNGSNIMFGARETGFGRGFDEVDVIVFDEAQILTERALGTWWRRRTSPGIHMGRCCSSWAPAPADRPWRGVHGPSERGVGGEMVDRVYVECSADESATPTTGSSGRKRTRRSRTAPRNAPCSACARTCRRTTSWMREALGVWDDTSTKSAIPAAVWADLYDIDTAQPHPFALGVSMSADRKWTTIGLAGHRSDRLIHLELLKVGRGSTWVIERLHQMERKPVGTGVLTTGRLGRCCRTSRTGEA